MVESIIKSFDIWTDAQGVKSKGRVKSIDNISLDGIEHLRELILELAIRGKLVLQDPADEPATDSLEKTQKLNEVLVKEGKRKKSKTLPAIREDEQPFDLPEGWSFVRLNDIGDWGSGATPNRSNHKYYGGNIPWFKSGELNSDYIEQAEEFITELALKETSLRYNDIGDVLIAMYGATIGKTSILKVRATTNQAVCACTPFQCISNTYLLTLLKAYNTRFTKMGAGGAQPNISREKIIATVIALPPVLEQHRIVAKVEELMALCDILEREKTANLKTHQTLVAALLQTLTTAKDAGEVEAAWHRLAPHFDTLFCTEDSIDQLKQAILQLAVMGRLVNQDPADEPASELLKKIEKEKEKLVKEGKIKKEKVLAEIRDEEKPFALPEGWEWVRLGAITQINPRNDKDGNLKVSFVPMALVTTSYKGEHGQEERTWNEISKGFTHFADGDVGVAKITPCFENSKAVVFSNLINGYGAGTTELHIARPFGKTIEARFILLILKSPEYLKLGESKMTGTAGQKRLSKEFFSENPMPLPPLEEQKRIVAKVDALMALCDNLKGRLLKSQEIQSNLSKTIIENAVA